MKAHLNFARCAHLKTFLFAGVACCAAMLTASAAQAQQQDPGCPGASVPLDVSSNLKPFARLKIHGRDGNFLIDTGAVASHIDANQFGLQPGNAVTLNSPVPILPTVNEVKFTVQDLTFQNQFAPPGGYGGAIGTSVLITRTIAFHYNSNTPYLVIPRQPCSPQYFEQFGYVPISQRGFYGPSNPTGTPIIYAQIGPVRAPVWVDSGLGGNTKHLTLDINASFFQKLRDAGIRMKQTGSIIATDCKGAKLEDQKWKVDGTPLVFTTETGQLLFEYSPPDLEVSGPSQCGLIGSHTEPLGTVGALMLARWGTVIFDGPNELVWVTKNRQPVTAQIAYQSLAIAQGDEGGYATVTNSSADVANAQSLKGCSGRNTNCKIVATLGQHKYECVAVAFQAVGKFIFTTSNSIATAQGAAMSTCVERGGGTTCKIVDSICND